MTHRILVATVLGCLFVASGAFADGKIPPVGSSESTFLLAAHPARLAKAATDTFELMGPNGGGAPYVGDFENAAGQAAWSGWSSMDETAGPVRWSVSTLDPASGSYGAWCGEQTPLWTGYGNNYNESLVWTGAVANPALPCTVMITATVHHNVEVSFDGCHVGVETAGGIQDLWSGDGAARDVPINVSFVYTPSDYLGGASDEVQVYFRVASDQTYSDEDGYYPTGNPIGAMHVDDVTVILNNGTGFSHDFEDATLGPFTTPQTSFGDFAKIWTGLGDRDDCRDNVSPQVGFVDDGEVVTGTGGTPCALAQYCYGPDGFVLNTSGGLLGPDMGVLANSIVSPAMAWPDPTHDGAVLEFDVYSDSRFAVNEAVIGYSWYVRSTSAMDPSALELEPWLSDDAFFMGGPQYFRSLKLLAHLLVPDPHFVQVKLTVTDYSPLYEIYGFGGSASPGPYFDNVRVTTFAGEGSVLQFKPSEIAQDGFPANGLADLGDPGQLSVRFDMANDISASGDGRIDPGDSIVVSVAPRGGAVFTENPRLHYRLEPNPLFDPYRTSGFPMAGSVLCADRGEDNGGFHKFSADLPDTGFLFPGDVLHYYFAATDQGADTRTATLPDTVGFGDFSPDSPFPRLFTVHALPSLQDQFGQQPRILFWDDSGVPSTGRLWRETLHGLGFLPGEEYDEYVTVAPARGEANGLGGRATSLQIMGYETILYTSGAQSSYTLAYDDGFDVYLLEEWLQDGARSLLLCGDHLASNLDNVASDFLRDHAGVESGGITDVAPLIGGQQSPGVADIADFWREDLWYLNGGCPGKRTFDYVYQSGAERLSGFTEAGGGAVIGGTVAASRVFDLSGTDISTVIYLPFGLEATAADPLADAKLHWGPHVGILADFLLAAGNPVSGGPLPAMAEFGFSSRPNPFNPTTNIQYTVPRAGRLEIAVFDLAGRRVATLIDRMVTDSGTVPWNGTNDDGRRVSSGVYFCKAVFEGEVSVRKLAMVK